MGYVQAQPRSAVDFNRRVGTAGWGGVIALALVALLGLAGQAKAAESCPNEAIREIQGSTSLPECRAYEQLTPTAKNGYNAQADTAQAAIEGPGLGFATKNGAAFPGSTGNQRNVYLGQEDSGSWTSTPLIPGSPLSSPSGVNGLNFEKQFTPDLSSFLYYTNDPLVPEDQNWTGLGTGQDYYRRNPDGSWTWLTRGSEGGTQSANFAATEDLRGLVFSDTGSLDPAHPVTPNGFTHYLYYSEGGTPRMVGVLPNGEPAPDAVIGKVRASGNTFGYQANALSEDGTKVVFGSTEPGVTSALNLWLRDGSETRLVSKFEDSGLPSDEETFYVGAVWGPAADEGAVFFSTVADLTGSDPRGGLYEYDLKSDSVSFLAPASNAENGEGVVDCTQRPNRCSGVAAISDNGERIYFGTSELLVPGRGQANKPNLYVLNRDTGELDFIATLAAEPVFSDRPADRPPNATFFRENNTQPTAQANQVSAGGGRYFAFESKAQLTGFDNEGVTEIYRYDAVAKDLACVSCSTRPVRGTSMLRTPNFLDSQGESRNQLLTGLWYGYYQPRYMLANGDVFFNSSQDLVPTDSNHTTDAYLWHDGKISLLSAGKGIRSYYVDASADGRNAYIQTSSALAPQDIDGLFDIYDVRVDGGLPGQNRLTVPACAGEGCQGESSGAAEQASAGSRMVSGQGNSKQRRAHRKQHSKHRSSTARKNRKRHKRHRSRPTHPVSSVREGSK